VAGEALGGAAEGSYEQEAAVVEEDEEMEREDERGVAKRPDLNELDVPEWAELALDKIEWRKLLQRIALSRWRQRAAGRAQRLGCGVRLGARKSLRRFSQRAQPTQRQSGMCTAGYKDHSHKVRRIDLNRRFATVADRAYALANPKNFQPRLGKGSSEYVSEELCSMSEYVLQLSIEVKLTQVDDLLSNAQSKVDDAENAAVDSSDVEKLRLMVAKLPKIKEELDELRGHTDASDITKKTQGLRKRAAKVNKFLDTLRGVQNISARNVANKQRAIDSEPEPKKLRTSSSVDLEVVAPSFSTELDAGSIMPMRRASIYHWSLW
jgi:hypothetical protein